MSALYTAVATVDGTGRSSRAVSTDGNLDVQMAPPKELGGSGQGTNPEQLFAAGYAGCFSSAVGAVARAQKLDVSGMTVTAEVSIGADADGGYGLAVVLRIELPEALQGEAGRQIVEQAHQGCPYSRATRGNIPVELVIE